MMARPHCPVVTNHVKGAGNGDHELVAASQRMTGPAFALRHVVEVEHPPNIKRDMALAFYEHQVTARILDLRKLQHLRSCDVGHGDQNRALCSSSLASPLNKLEQSFNY